MIRYSPLATDLTAREVNAQRTEADREHARGQSHDVCAFVGCHQVSIPNKESRLTCAARVTILASLRARSTDTENSIVTAARASVPQ